VDLMSAWPDLISSRILASISSCLPSASHSFLPSFPLVILGHFPYWLPSSCLTWLLSLLGWL
jgi:hypothetical protein